MNPKISPNRPARILLVEDNDDDAELTRIGFQQNPLPIDLHHVRNGEKCLAFLRKESSFVDAPTPDLILLDLNMPRMDGREALAEIRADKQLQHFPVVILTTSSADEDISHAYRLGCNSYIVKPVDFMEFSRITQLIADYWFTAVVLPPG